MQENRSAAGALPPDPAGGSHSAPPDSLAGGEGADCPLPKNATPEPHSFGLWLSFVLERSLKSAYWLAYVIIVVMFLVYVAFQSARYVA